MCAKKASQQRQCRNELAPMNQRECEKVINGKEEAVKENGKIVASGDGKDQKEKIVSYSHQQRGRKEKLPSHGANRDTFSKLCSVSLKFP